MVSERQIDEVDRRLIALLQGNGRLPAASLAAHVGLSRSAVQERLARLERQGVIAGYTVRLGGPPKPGVAAYLFLRLEGPLCRILAPQLAKLPEIVSAETLAGEIDLVLRVEAADIPALDRVREAVATMRGVQSVSTAAVMTAHFDRRPA
ncbi:MAG TPA: Lrp/AsnC family transcriptional regulator [Alphaproteobacteria bacterium]|nr:Lrp/AsnC family transcriptional regulator [Alphaproteobacteria bacterium]